MGYNSTNQPKPIAKTISVPSAPMKHCTEYGI